MRRYPFYRILLIIVLTAVIFSTFYCPAVKEVQAAPLDDTIYTFDLQKYTESNPDHNDAGNYDFSLFLSTLQGIVNKAGPRLYIFANYTNTLPINTSREVKNIDRFWFEQFRKRGQWLSEYNVVNLNTLDELMEVFQSEITGVVLWDSKVDSTANIATTIAGIINAPIAMKGGSLAGELCNTYGLNVQMDLSGRFSGANAKTDAYAWLKAQYIDTGLVNPGMVGYVVDSLARQPNTFPINYTNCRDYLVQQKAVVLDLSPYADEKPRDAPNQTLGADRAMFDSILQELQDQYGDYRPIRGIGFVPWWDKYTNFASGSNSNYGNADAEMQTTELFSSHGIPMVTGTFGYDQANLSFHMHAPVASKMSPPFTEPSAPVLQNKTYVLMVNGDFDGSSVSDYYPMAWKDERRGNTEQCNSIVPIFMEDTPDMLEYLYNTATPMDAFSACASGAGYVSPSYLPDTGLWSKWNKYWYGRTGYTYTSFMHNGHAGVISSDMEKLYSEFSNDGLIGWGYTSKYNGIYSVSLPYPDLRNDHMAVDGFTLVSSYTMDIAAATINYYAQQLAGADIGQAPHFISFHTAYSNVSFFEELEKKVKADHPNYNYEFVDQYTYSYLIHLYKLGNPLLDSNMISVDVPDEMIAGEDYPVTVTVRNYGTGTWTYAAQDKLGSSTSNQFIWKDFADGGTSNGVTNQRVFLSSSDAIAPLKTKTFSFTVEAPAVPGNYTFGAQMLREGTAWQGQIYSKVVNVTARPSDAARIVSIDAPDTAAEGSSVPVTITMKNAGTAAWTYSSGYKLGCFDRYDITSELAPENDFIWTNLPNGGTFDGPSRQTMNLSGTDSIQPGETKSFTFNIEIPDKRGTYTLTASMLHEGSGWFGEVAVKDIRVYPADAAAKDAALIDAAIPIHLAPGEYANVAVSVKNVGTNVWTRDGNYTLAATSSNQVMWSSFRDGGSGTTPTTVQAWLGTTDSVGAEQSKTFVFKIQAPSAAGTYTLEARMKDAAGFFGDTFTFTVKSVPALNSELVSDYVPETMIAGSKRVISIEVKNTGSEMWGPYNPTPHNLGAVAGNQFIFTDFINAPGSFSIDHETQRVFMCSYDPYGKVQNIRGDCYQFNFSIIAPSTPGKYKLRVRMVKDGVAWFGPVFEWEINVVGSTYEKRVDCGSASNFTDSHGRVWLSDRAYNLTDGWGYTGATDVRATANAIEVYDDNNSLTIENDQQIYKTGRVGAGFGYRFNVPDGEYEVELSVAEIVASSEGLRRFGIDIEGKRYVWDYDPFILLNGKFKGRDIKFYNIQVLDGQLNIDFPASTGNALVNAIKVTRVDIEDHIEKATNKAVTASGVWNGYMTFAPEKAVDENDSTYWAANNDGSATWIKVDLGSVTSIERIKLKWNYLSSKEYTISISENDVNYTTVKTGSTASAYPGYTDDWIPRSKARYVKISSGNYQAIYSLLVFGIDDAKVPDKSAGSTATASGVWNDDQRFLPSMAVDVFDTTYWAANNDGAPTWIKIDLGSVTKVQRFKIKWAYLLTKEYTIEVSEDDTVYTQVKAGTVGSVYPGFTDDWILDTDVRYIKIRSNNYQAIYNISVF